MTVCYWCGAKDTLADVGKELDDGKYKMVQCSKCKNAYYVLNKEKVNKPKPMTNEEYIHSLNTEQLAEALLNIMANNEFTLYLLHTEKKSVQEMKDAVVEWLKQPHGEVGK